MKRLVFAFFLGSLSASTFAERYYVEQDSFGNFDAVKADEVVDNKRPETPATEPAVDPANEERAEIEQAPQIEAQVEPTNHATTQPETTQPEITPVAIEPTATQDSRISEDSRVPEDSREPKDSVVSEQTGEESSSPILPPASSQPPRVTEAPQTGLDSSVGPAQRVEVPGTDTDSLPNGGEATLGSVEAASKPSGSESAKGLQETLGVFGASESASGVEVTADADAKVTADVRSDDRPKEVEKPRKLSKFERVFLESEGQNPYDATTVDDSDFVDGDELLQGRAVRDNERPFFVTKDFDGNESVTFYSPTLAREQRENADKKLKFSKATIFSKADSSEGAQFELPESADPLAVKLLSSGRQDLSKSYFENFAQTCCEKLPRNYIKELFLDRSSLLELGRELLTYRFSEGDSRYLIAKLPEADQNLALQVRAFINKYEDQGVDLGVFFPQIVTLSKEFKALRIISDPVMEYTPETWSNYGYLEGVFEIDRESENEAYILIHTTGDTLRRRSSFDHPTAPVNLKHMSFGSLGVKAVRTN